MISPKLGFTIFVLWLILRDFVLCSNESSRTTVFLSGASCKKAHESSLYSSLHKWTEIVTKSLLPFLLIILTNDVQINPGPVPDATIINHGHHANSNIIHTLTHEA